MHDDEDIDDDIRFGFPKFAPPIHQDAVMHFQALYTFASCRCRSMPVCILIDSVVSDAVRLVIAVCTVGPTRGKSVELSQLTHPQRQTGAETTRGSVGWRDGGERGLGSSPV